MKVRKAQAVWQGTLREGQGTVSFGEGAFEGPYSWAGRFEEGPGTNPEELLGAAEAACFTMSLSSGLTRAGHPPERIETTANVHFEKLEGGWTVTRIVLETEARVPGVEPQAFQELAENAKTTCPISRALGPVELVLEARLTSG
ncbi:MAG TPA: OsmC family protein [Anaerolineales bacterium]